jgi:D-3-phosphoglycerate dehydrogenase
VTISEQVLDFLRTGAVTGAVNVPAVAPEAVEAMRPFLLLGEKLGSFETQFFDLPVSEVQITYSGEVAERDVNPITRSILTGMLARVSARVNQVNAMLIAEERGLRVVESRVRASSDFTSLIEVIVRGDNGESRVAGALFGRSEPRLVGIDAHRIEAVPEGDLLVVRNGDQPGVVGRIGTFLGDHGINIAQLYLSRNRAGGVAMSVYQVDHALDAATLAELGRVPHVIVAKQITL